MPHQIIEALTARWTIEVTSADDCEIVGLDATRGRCTPTPLRVEPNLFSFDTLVALRFAELRELARREPVVI